MSVGKIRRQMKLSGNTAEAKLVQERAILEAVVKNLEQQAWFNGWQASLHPFPPTPAEPEVLTLHVFRVSWLNSDHKGIHFETFLGPRELKKQETTLALHMFHHDYIPGTQVKPTKLSRAVIEATYNKISKWKGYKFKTGMYGTQPFKLVLDLSSGTFEEDLVKELECLCRELGPVIDAKLTEILP